MRLLCNSSEGFLPAVGDLYPPTDGPQRPSSELAGTYVQRVHTQHLAMHLHTLPYDCQPVLVQIVFIWVAKPKPHSPTILKTEVEVNYYHMGESSG